MTVMATDNDIPTAGTPTALPELLAPAGGPDELAAALKAGADAVYFGLKKLNARTGAKNFPPETLKEVVQSIHDAHAKAYLTLNIDLSQRELGLAARTLALAEQAHVDAVLIRDPAILAFIPAFPKLAFHFSTQAAITTSAGVEAAKSFGITRVVLARELSEDEMKATIGHGVEIEVFVQGALCFSCSGRCLLSSWVGGRSGNRGACASPCRVRWTNQKGVTSTPLSMHDMCLAGDLAKLAEIGVDSLKIEGRLKSAPWVSKTVSLYREALNGSLSNDELTQSTAKLGAYAGRQMSNVYFHGIRTDVTGESARPAGEQTADFRSDCQADTAAASENSVRVYSDDTNGTLWHLTYNNHETTLRTPPQRVANERRAIEVAEIAIELARLLATDGQMADIKYSPDSLQDRLLPRNAGNRVMEEATAFMRRNQKETDGVVRDIVLPQAVREILEAPRNKCVENKLRLGDRAALLRVTPSQAEECFANRKSMLGSCKLIVDSQVCAETDIKALAIQLIEHYEDIFAIALPSVIYEADIPAIRDFLSLVAPVMTIEVNSWDTWQLAREAQANMIAGEGMAVLNALAAKHLASLGCMAAAVSCEIDSEQLEALCDNAETPLILTVFSYPALMRTRAVLPDGFGCGNTLSDGRKVTLRPVREGSVTALRSTIPMDWRKLHNPKIRVSQLVIDLTGAENLQDAPSATSLFNYDRRLR